MYGFTSLKEIKPPIIIPSTSKQDVETIQNDKPKETQLISCSPNDFTKLNDNSHTINDNNDLIDLSDSSSDYFSIGSNFNCSQNSVNESRASSSYSSQISNQSVNSKKSYDLVDLMENILVTPLDVRQDETLLKEINIFFDKYENNEKNPVTDKESLKTDGLLQFIDTTPRVEAQKSECKSESNMINIEELIQNKSVLDVNLDRPAISPVQRFNNEDEQLIEDVIYSKNVEKLYITNSKLLESTQKIKAGCFANMKESSFTKSPKTQSNALKINDLIPKPTSINTEVINRINIFNPLIYYTPKYFFTSQNIEVDFFKVLAVKKDSKVYSKKRIITSDEDRRRYTVGPSIEEKKLVLPQMMLRLVMKKNLMEKDKGLKKRYVLDVGTANEKGYEKTTNGLVELNPELLMEDCNKERERAFKTRQVFDSFVRTGNIIG